MFNLHEPRGRKSQAREKFFSAKKTVDKSATGLLPIAFALTNPPHSGKSPFVIRPHYRRPSSRPYYRAPPGEKRKADDNGLKKATPHQIETVISRQRW
jgi:hypothetical protein